MKQIITNAMVVAMTAAGLAGCAQDGTMEGSDMGTIVGGIAGGFLGSQFGEGGGKIAMSIAGAMAGAWVGNKVAQGLSTQDRGYYDRAAYQAQTAPVGETITWYNPQSGAQGAITPTRDGRSSGGEYCREYQQTITVGGRTERAYGTACKQPDGSWKIVS